MPKQLQRGAKMDKKAFVSVHAGMFFLVGLVIGLVGMYFLIAKGIIPVSLPGAP